MCLSRPHKATSVAADSQSCFRVICPVPTLIEMPNSLRVRAEKKDKKKVVRLRVFALSSEIAKGQNIISCSSPHVCSKTSATHSAERMTMPVYPHNKDMQQNINCTHAPIKTQCSPLMKNRRIKFCLFSAHTVCITPLVIGTKEPL